MNQIRFSKLWYVVLLFALVACQAQVTPPASTAVPSTPIPPPPTAVPPTAAPTVAPAQAQTTFSSKIYRLHMSVSFGPDWQVIDDFTDLVTVAHGRGEHDWNVGFNIVTNAKVADPVSGAQIPFPEDFASWIKSNPDFKADEPTEVTVAGTKGLQIDATPPSTKQKAFLYLSGTNWNSAPSPERWRFILLNDVNGERLLIMLLAPADQFKVAVEQAQEILNTVSFPKPSATVPSAYPLLVEHKIPTFIAHAGGITVGPDGALWFVETGANQIAQITVAGVVTEYPVPTEDAIDDSQGFIGVGPDGALWFNEDLVNKLGRITTAGEITEFDLPKGLAPIRALVAAPDGALWATSLGANAILKLTTDGKIAAKYVLPKPDSTPVGMVVGPDDAFWFVEAGANQIGRITAEGKLSEYPLPKENSFPLRITVGPDKALWFSLRGAKQIGRISLDGKVTTFDAGMGPVGIAAGADGALWFTGYDTTEVGRLTAEGVLTKVAVPTYASIPYHIAAGPDGSLWFTEQQGNQIGQIQLSAP